MLSVLGSVLGSYVICGAWFDWDFFMENRRAAPVLWLFGRNGARAVYALVGLSIVGMSVAAALRVP